MSDPTSRSFDEPAPESEDEIRSRETGDPGNPVTARVVNADPTDAEPTDAEPTDAEPHEPPPPADPPAVSFAAPVRDEGDEPANEDLPASTTAYEPVSARPGVESDAPVAEETPAAEEAPAAVEEQRPAPVVEEARPAPVVEEQRPAPAVEEARPAPVVEEQRPAPAVEEARPAPVVEEQPLPPAAQQPVAPMFISTPEPPTKSGNRLYGIGVAAIATLVFAILWAAVDAAFVFANTRSLVQVPEALAQQPYWVPVIIFFLAFVVLVVIVNRARWVAYVFGGFAVGIACYLAFVIVGLNLGDLRGVSSDQLMTAVRQVALNPFAFIAGILGREVPVWFGAWIAAHGRRVTERNARARDAYERDLADGPSAYAAGPRTAY